MKAVDREKHIKRFFERILSPDQVLEIRALEVEDGRFARNYSGYFDGSSLDQLATAVVRLGDAKGVYFTPNPVVAPVLARCSHKLKPCKAGAVYTQDSEIARRRWLLVDLDPTRVAGISSSDEEHTAALERAELVQAALTEAGWPEPVRLDSGNGAHLMYRIDEPNDGHSGPTHDLITRCLKALEARYSVPAVKVDQSVHNASRIWKVPYTWARKGEDVPERPHRMGRVLHMPAELEAVTTEQLQALAAEAPAAAPKAQKSSTPRGSASRPDVDSTAWMDAFMAEHFPGLRERAWRGGRKWILPCCVWNGSHTDKSAFVGQLPSGAFTAKCSHNSCQGLGWEEFRAALEPLGREVRSAPGEGRERAEKQPASRAAQHAPVALDEDGDELECPADLPEIQAADVRLRVLSRRAVAAVVEANEPPTVFEHRMGMARVLVGPDDEPTIDILSKDALRGVLDRCANWLGKDQKGRTVVIYPPSEVVSDVLALPERPLPALEGVTQCPVFGEDGSLADRPGYNPGARCWYQRPSDLHLRPLPPRPSDADLERARDILCTPYREFPFPDQDVGSSLAHSVAGMLLPFGRRLISGPTPLHLVTSAQVGSGKGLLCDVMTIPATGATSRVTCWTKDEDELRKRATAALLEGATYVHLDNIPQSCALESGNLAALLTSTKFSDRVLGRNEMMKVVVQCGWLMTAVNPILSTELARRSILIRLDAGVEAPWKGRTFRVKDLAQATKRQRSVLVWACLTAWQAWLARGRPAWDGEALASFESWSAVMGGVLEVLGLPGFLRNREHLWDAAEKDLGPWQAFVKAWWALHKGAPVGVSLLFDLCINQHLLGDDLGAGNDDSKRSKLGKRLTGAVDRVLAGFKIVKKGKDRGGSNTYVLQPVLGVAGGALVTQSPPPAQQNLYDERDWGPSAGGAGGAGVSPAHIRACAHAAEGDSLTYARGGTPSTPCTPSSLGGKPYESKADECRGLQHLSPADPQQPPAVCEECGLSKGVSTGPLCFDCSFNRAQAELQSLDTDDLP